MYEEPVEDNPFLEPFYKDLKDSNFPSTAAYHLQVGFLGTRIGAHIAAQFMKFEAQLKAQQKLPGKKGIVQDRGLFEDRFVFAQMLNRDGIISDRDFKAYCLFYDNFMKYIENPDLVVYLRAPLDIQIERIRKRGRKMELEMLKPGDDYLIRLGVAYNGWYESYAGKKISLDSSTLDFANVPEDQRKLVEIVQRELAA
jgi:deoxyadenosine/deoxycytidine kinase